MLPCMIIDADKVRYEGKIRKCPRCGQEKALLKGFGLRRKAYPNDSTRYRVLARTYCKSCHVKMARKRIYADPVRLEKYLEACRRRNRKRIPQQVEYNKKWRAANRERANSYAKKHRLKYPWKHAARLAAKAIHPVAQTCIAPGCKEVGHRHHTDYSDPYKIIWLCPKHHGLAHRITEESNDKICGPNENN